ncbi:MAG: NAD-dependent epimerase/dehydratase family protein [Patescibacteria group bacterium]
MSRMLVTGGAGFIGSHLVDMLLRHGHSVSVVDDLSTGRRSQVQKRARFFKANVCSPRLRGIFSQAKPDCVFHLAAQKSISRSVANPAFDAEQNIIGSLNVLQQCVKAGVKKFIFSSTGGAIYGDTPHMPTDEKHIEQPVSPYGVAKLAIDKYLHYYHSVYGLRYVSLRYANVYGPRQDPEGEAGVVAIFLDRILKHRQALINGHGRQTRDYVYVDDVIAANRVALRPKLLGIYNIGTSRQTSVNNLFRKLKKISGTAMPEKHARPMKGEQQRSCLSYRKIQHAAGWKPRVPLEQGLALTYEWFKEHYEKKYS